MIFWQIVLVLFIGALLTGAGAVIGGAIVIAARDKKGEHNDEQTG